MYSFNRLTKKDLYLKLQALINRKKPNSLPREGVLNHNQIDQYNKWAAIEIYHSINWLEKRDQNGDLNWPSSEIQLAKVLYHFITLYLPPVEFNEPYKTNVQAFNKLITAQFQLDFNITNAPITLTSIDLFPLRFIDYICLGMEEISHGNQGRRQVSLFQILYDIYYFKSSINAREEAILRNYVLVMRDYFLLDKMAYKKQNEIKQFNLDLCAYLKKTAQIENLTGSLEDALQLQKRAEQIFGKTWLQKNIDNLIISGLFSCLAVFVFALLASVFIPAWLTASFFITSIIVAYGLVCLKAKQENKPYFLSHNNSLNMLVNHKLIDHPVETIPIILKNFPPQNF